MPIETSTNARIQILPLLMSPPFRKQAAPIGISRMIISRPLTTLRGLRADRLNRGDPRRICTLTGDQHKEVFMHARLISGVIAVVLLLGGIAPSRIYANDKDAPSAAKDDGKVGAKDDKSAAKDDEIKLPPFPSDKVIHQVMQLGARTLKYEATVGSLPVFDEKGKQIASVMFTAYTIPGAGRPVTFALNGGPGASSVYLNLGAIGPKRVQFGAEGNSPSDPPTPVDNPGTWLDFTDLVFIDPVGTGFSYSQVKEEEAKKRFYNPKSDVEYLSRVIFDWLVKNQRLTSNKYLV